MTVISHNLKNIIVARSTENIKEKKEEKKRRGERKEIVYQSKGFGAFTLISVSIGHTC